MINGRRGAFGLYDNPPVDCCERLGMVFERLASLDCQSRVSPSPSLPYRRSW